jgi:hypothetical protein
MGRPPDPNAKNIVKLHVANGYSYACTQPPIVNPDTGKKEYNRVHWGGIDEKMKFIPGARFYEATPEERAQLIFPENWDLSEAEKFTGLRGPGRPSCDGLCHNRLYGDIWLLEQVALKTGVRQDLEAVFAGNKEIVDDIFTLAIFPYLTNFTYNRLAGWQEIAAAPSSRELTPSVITRLTQTITEWHRMEFLRLRGLRLGKDELCAIDTTSRSAYGEKLADIQWGKNKEGLSLPQTTEVVVYTLSSHMPVYYRTFPGNIPDSRTYDIILKDLEHASFKNIVLITDRGFETLNNLKNLILRNQSMIMCTKVTQKYVLQEIEALGEFNKYPESMKIDEDNKLFYSQHDLNIEFEDNISATKLMKKLKLNLYFNLVRNSQELIELQIQLQSQSLLLDDILKNNTKLDDDATLKKDFNYYNLEIDEATRQLISYTLNEKKVLKAKKTSGFFAIISNGLDFSPVEVLSAYNLRDEQEKYFQQMKSQMGSDRQRNWSEAGKTGRLLILFVSLILSSYVRYIWKSTDIKQILPSSLAILDKMRSIRYIQHPNRAKVITPFVGAQVEICKSFEFEIPKGCCPFSARPQSKRKRGRPPKTKV